MKVKKPELKDSNIFWFLVAVVLAMLTITWFDYHYNKYDRAIYEMDEETYTDIVLVLNDSLGRCPSRLEVADYYINNYK